MPSLICRSPEEPSCNRRKTFFHSSLGAGSLSFLCPPLCLCPPFNIFLSRLDFALEPINICGVPCLFHSKLCKCLGNLRVPLLIGLLRKCKIHSYFFSLPVPVGAKVLGRFSSFSLYLLKLAGRGLTDRTPHWCIPPLMYVTTYRASPLLHQHFPPFFGSCFSDLKSSFFAPHFSHFCGLHLPSTLWPHLLHIHTAISPPLSLLFL